MKLKTITIAKLQLKQGFFKEAHLILTELLNEGKITLNSEIKGLFEQIKLLEIKEKYKKLPLNLQNKAVLLNTFADKFKKISFEKKETDFSNITIFAECVKKQTILYRKEYSFTDKLNELLKNVKNYKFRKTLKPDFSDLKIDVMIDISRKYNILKEINLSTEVPVDNNFTKKRKILKEKLNQIKTYKPIKQYSLNIDDLNFECEINFKRVIQLKNNKISFLKKLLSNIEDYKLKRI